MRLAFPPDLDCSGLRVTVRESEPIPTDRVGWRRAITGHEMAATVATPSGWPLSIVEAGPSLWGFYELFDRGVVVEVSGDRARAHAYLLAGDLDRAPREVVALAQLWSPT